MAEGPDILDRLRKWECPADFYTAGGATLGGLVDDLDVAADEIVRLRSLVERLATSVTFWHAHADVDAHHNAPPPLTLLAEARAALEATDGE